MAGCSTRVVTRCFFSGWAARALKMAVLSDSEPQEVKISSKGSQPNTEATSARAFLSCTPTWPPKECMLEGLP